MTAETVHGVRALEVTFRLDPLPGADGKQRVTIACAGNQPYAIGHLAAAGEAVAAYGSGEGEPRVGVYADVVRALGGLMEVAGRQIANEPGDDDDD